MLATDPGAWNMIGWMLVLGAAGGVIFWVVTTLLLRGRSTEAQETRAPGSP